MSVVHGMCNMCGTAVAAVEVEIPHATPAKLKSAGVSRTATLCAAICQECAVSIASAWARHGAADWARWIEDRKTGRTQGASP